MSSDHLLSMEGVWKKYSLAEVFHRSLREDFSRLFTAQKSNPAVDEFWALKDISFHVGRGECVCLSGPNGAGKSTILKILSNVTFPDRGEVSVKGRIAPLIEVGAGFHPDLTGRQNIFMNGTIIGMRISEIRSKLQDIIEISELGSFIDTPVKKYSSGMYLKLAVAIAMQSSADVLLIDEILSVADSNFKNRCIELINRVKTSGRAVLLVSHEEALVDAVSDRKVFIRNGKIV